MIVAITLSATARSGFETEAHSTGEKFTISTIASDHYMSAQKSSPGNRTHYHCGSGGSCFQFGLADQQTLTRLQSVEVAIATQMPILATRSIVPPLPPPIFFIIAQAKLVLVTG